MKASITSSGSRDLGLGQALGLPDLQGSVCFLPRPPGGPAPQHHDGKTPPGGCLPLCEDEFRGLHRPSEILCHQLLHSLR